MMKSQRNNVIGFLTDRIVTRPETVDIARGVSETARELGQTVLFMTHSDASPPLHGPEYNSLMDLNVDGLIYAAHTSMSESSLRRRNLFALPSWQIVFLMIRTLPPSFPTTWPVDFWQAKC